MSKNGLGKFALGAGIGAALGLLFAPKKGEEMRSDLKKAFDDLIAKAKSIDIEEVKITVEDRIEEIKEGLDNLTKEDVLSEAKKQAKKLRNQAEELVEYAIEKGTPVIEKSANAVKEKVVEVSGQIIEKLSKDKKTK